MKLTKHQARVLAALLGLWERHGCRWWSRHAIGGVVLAGGYHDVIQRRTMIALEAAGLVMLEYESWPPEIRLAVRCNCAFHFWGLTAAGEELARGLKIVWTREAARGIEAAKITDWMGRHHDDDDDEWGDDDGPAPAPAPRPQAPAFA